MTAYRIKANKLAAQAWMSLGKAREFRRLARFEPHWDQDGIKQSVGHCVQIARMAMHTAVLYRQMEGRL